MGEGVGMCVGGGRRRGIRMSVCLFSRVLGDGWSRITLAGIVCSVDNNLCPLVLGLLKVVLTILLKAIIKRFRNLLKVKSNYKEI